MTETIAFGVWPALDSESLDSDNKPVVDNSGAGVSETVDTVSLYKNSDADGTGSWTDFHENVSDTAFVYGQKTEDSGDGHIMLIAQDNGGTSNGDLSMTICTSSGGQHTCTADPESDSVSDFALRIGYTSELPTHLWIRKTSSDAGELFCRQNDQKDGLGTWDDDINPIRADGPGESTAFVSLERLTNGGWHSYFLFTDLLDGPNFYEWTYEATSVASCVDGDLWSGNDPADWNAATIDGIGVLGIDGDGSPYVVREDDNDDLDVWENDDNDGTGIWALRETISFTCSDIVPDLDRAVNVGPSSIPSILAFCANGDLHYCKSDGASANGVWSCQRVATGALAEHTSMSLNVNDNGLPHISYVTPTPTPGSYDIQYIQSVGLHDGEYFETV